MNQSGSRFGKADRSFFQIVILSFILFSLYRLTFYSLYSYRLEGETGWEILKVFLLGLRFDWMTISLLFFGFYLLSQIPILEKKFWFRFFWFFASYFVLGLAIIHLFADLMYFENANKHIGYEAFVFLGDIFVLTKSLFLEAPFFSVGFFLFLSLYLVLVFLLWKSFVQRNVQDYPLLSFKRWGMFFLWVLFFFLGLRGGPQESPLRASEAIVSQDPFLNQVALNGVFTSLNDLKSQSIPKHLKMSEEEAFQIVREEIQFTGSQFLGKSDYPLLRKISSPKKEPLDIVLIIQESWTGKYVWPIASGNWEGKEITPFYNSLAKKGHSFSRFYANGGRTSNALLSILTSIPDKPGLTVIRTPQVLSQFSSLGNLLSERGYETTFLTGDDLRFDSLDTILPNWGFQNLIGKSEIQRTKPFPLGAWGFDDEYLYELALEKLKENPGKPKFLTVLTMTTHYPYKVPNKKYNLYNSNITDFEYLNTIHYADKALQNFMESVSKKPNFQNTIFIFVGDHTHHRYLTYYEDRMVPLLLYAPKWIKPKLDTRPASQLDILPTILGVLGGEFLFSGFGKNLFAKDLLSGTTYFAYGRACGWIDSEKILYQSVDDNTQFIFQMNPPYAEDRLCREDKKNCITQTKKAKAIFNLSTELLNQNRIFPKAKL